MTTRAPYLHKPVDLQVDDAIQVDLKGQEANVLLLDDANFASYKAGRNYAYQVGGHATRSPVVLRPPKPGSWHVVVDLGGHEGQVGASIAVLKA